MSAIERYAAKGGAAILLDRDGAILALASGPEFDPNLSGSYSAEAADRINNATASVFELGSVMKPFTLAYAVSENAVTSEAIFPTGDPFPLGPYNITDTHSVGPWASLKTIIKESSNIGTLHVFKQLGIEKTKAMIDRLGFGAAVPVELPGRGKPILPPSWTEVSAGTIAYGHGLSVSPLHMAAAYTVFTNAGVRRIPYVRPVSYTHLTLPTILLV